MLVTKDKIQYEMLANLFRYPKTGYIEQVNECAAILKDNYPKAYIDISPFVDVINSKKLFEIEEIFGKTFHIQAVCYLDLGYVLFGEDYKRGDFLVQMKSEQRKAKNDCGEELADNLPNVLSLLCLLEDEDFLGELSVRILLPALKKMLEEFDASRMMLRTKMMKKKQKVLIQENMEHKNIYQYAIQATMKVLQSDFKALHYPDQDVKPDLSSAFLPSCGTCS